MPQLSKVLILQLYRQVMLQSTKQLMPQLSKLQLITELLSNPKHLLQQKNQHKLHQKNQHKLHQKNQHKLHQKNQHKCRNEDENVRFFGCSKRFIYRHYSLTNKLKNSFWVINDISSNSNFAALIDNLLLTSFGRFLSSSPFATRKKTVAEAVTQSSFLKHMSSARQDLGIVDCEKIIAH